MQQRPVLVMGICGVGKSTIAAAIAESLDGRFIEADSYHDSASVARMRAGLPLTDEMRWGWLDRLGDAVVAAQKRAVLACSALGRAHRDRLRARTGPLDIVFLPGDRDIIAARVFGDENSLTRIEQVLHPLVRARERKFLGWCARQGKRQVVLDIPLLFETGGENRCDVVITVSAPAFVQEPRVLKRPGMTRERMASILARQMPDAEKRRRSDFVVLTGLGRDFSLLQIRNIVRLTHHGRGKNWPSRPLPGRTMEERAGRGRKAFA